MSGEFPDDTNDDLNGDLGDEGLYLDDIFPFLIAIIIAVVAVILFLKFR